MIKKFLNKNKPLIERSEKFSSEKSSEIKILYEEMVNKISKQKICINQEKNIIKELRRLEEKEEDDRFKKFKENSYGENQKDEINNYYVEKEFVDENNELANESELNSELHYKGALCKGTCHSHKVKKLQEIRRYESGQVHCQTCDVWLDHKGCHKKNGEPAEEDSVGIRCNCCNFQVRSKPRGKLYKEKLANKENAEYYDDEIEDYRTKTDEEILKNWITDVISRLDKLDTKPKIIEFFKENISHETYLRRRICYG